jgi:hypothetical protein
MRESAMLVDTKQHGMDERVASKLRQALTDERCHDPDFATYIVGVNPAMKAMLTVDAFGAVKGVADVVSGLKEGKDFLFAPPPPPSVLNMPREAYEALKLQRRGLNYRIIHSPGSAADTPRPPQPAAVGELKDARDMDAAAYAKARRAYTGRSSRYTDPHLSNPHEATAARRREGRSYR